MVSIINIGFHDRRRPQGMCTYELRINAKLISSFSHRRSDGLATCLRRAARSVPKDLNIPIHETWKIGSKNGR